MLETIGFLELNSIAKGVEAADLILKTAEVDLIFAKAGCPGKYYILFTGEVAAVKASLDAGAAIGGNHTVDSCVIPRVHPQVIKAINLAAEPGTPGAIGVMEFFSVTASVYAADAAVKAADVDLIDVRLGTGIGGKSFVVLTGEVSYGKITVGVLIGVIASLWVKNLHIGSFLTLLLSAVLFFGAYGGLLTLLREPLVWEIEQQMLGKIFHSSQTD